MSRIGDTICCYDVKGQKFLTYGKHYIVRSDLADCVEIRDDSNKYRIYFKSRFMFDIKRDRKLKLYKIYDKERR